MGLVFAHDEGYVSCGSSPLPFYKSDGWMSPGDVGSVRAKRVLLAPGGRHPDAARFLRQLDVRVHSSHWQKQFQVGSLTTRRASTCRGRLRVCIWDRIYLRNGLRGRYYEALFGGTLFPPTVRPLASVAVVIPDTKMFDAEVRAFRPRCPR